MRGRKADTTVAAPLTVEGTGASIFGSFSEPASAVSGRSGGASRTSVTRVGKAGAFATTMSLMLAVGVALATSLLVASSAQAGKLVDRVVGSATAGATGGLLNAPQEVAVNATGAGGVAAGTFYVVEQSNNRVSRFSPVGVFERAWGADVNLPAGGNNLEVCTVAASCKAGVASAGNGTTAGNGTLSGPFGIAVDGDTGNVYVTNRTARRIDVFTADGAFLRAFGFDVVAAGSPGDTGTGYEICVQANGDVCKTGLQGAGAGQLGGDSTGSYDIVISPPDGGAATGQVYVANTGNQRVEVYNLDGTSPSSIGSSANFALFYPRDLAIGGGVLYASDSADNNAVKRYDLNAASFLTPIDVSALPTDGVESNQETRGLDIDTDTGNLLVARGNAAAGLIEIGTPAGTPTFVDRHVTTLLHNGIAVNAVTDELLAFLNHRVLVLDDDGAIPPNVTLGAITDVTAEGATLNVTIESVATGLPTSYRFQVSTDGTDWTNIGSPGTVPDGATQNVSATTTGLLPNTVYRVRVVASRTLGNPDVISPESLFVTDATIPTIASSGVESVDTNSARVFAYVNPNSSQTTYRFEWGSSPDALVNRVPSPNGLLGAGAENVFAAETIAGLEPDTTYHYRLFASSAAGSTVTVVRSFTTRSAAPAERGWEMVSPFDKDPNAKAQEYQLENEPEYQVAPSGDRVFYLLAHGTAGSTVGGQSKFLATRGDSGWSSVQMTPALTADVPMGAGTAFSGRFGYMSPDLDCGVLAARELLTPDSSPVVRDHNGSNLFRRNPDGGYDWLTPEPSNATLTIDPNEHSWGWDVRGVSPDCANVVFETRYRFGGVNNSGVYRSHGGVLSDVAVRPDGSAAPSARVGSSATFHRAVSADASHVYFQAVSNDGNDSGRQALYLHREGQATVKVSGSETATVNRGAAFQIASTDGERVAFMANYGLTASSSSGPVATACTNLPPQPCALYVYDVATGDLVDISATADAANTNGATVGGVLGASDDMSRIYFAAQGQLVPGEGRTYAQNIANGTNSQDSTYNVYLYTAGEGLSYVGLVTRFNLFTANQGNVTVGAQYKTSQVTPDGRTLVFVSAADNVGYDSGGIAQAYLFSADSGEVGCVSCRRDGERPVLLDLDLATTSLTDEELSQPIVFRNGERTLSEMRVISDDGSRVVFAMHDALAAGAVEGNQNIYLWDRGTLTVLDTGRAPTSTIYFLADQRELSPHVIGMSPSGDDVFIRTPSDLVAQDGDGAKDVYDYRVGGGFPAPPPEPAPCAVLADACHGGGSSPTAGPVASDAPGGANADSGERRTLTLVGLSARRGVVLARVRSSSAGRITAIARARVRARRGNRGKGGVRRVARARTRTRASGGVVVRLRLNGAARRTLRAGGRLRVAVRVSMPGARARSATVLLRNTDRVARRATPDQGRAGR